MTINNNDFEELGVDGIQQSDFFPKTLIDSLRFLEEVEAIKKETHEKIADLKAEKQAKFDILDEEGWSDEEMFWKKVAVAEDIRERIEKVCIERKQLIDKLKK